MNPRPFVALLVSVWLCAGGRPAAAAGVVHLVDTQTQSTTILVPGLTSELKVLQITDAHISRVVPAETNMLPYGGRMHQAYATTRRHFSQNVQKSTFDYLGDVLQRAKEQQVELLLLTGDIVNFPSAASVDYVHQRLKQTGIPWLYIAGNHDWHYEGLPGSLEKLRATWTKRSLRPLYQGHNPLCYSAVIKGINFVGIDNSTGSVSAEQVGFLKKQLRRKEPVVLFSHIPYTLEGKGALDLATLVGPARAEGGGLVAIFAGHTHRASYCFSGDTCQYVSLAGFQGASFMVRFKGATRN